MPGYDKNPVNYIEAFLLVPRHIHDAVCDFIIENYSGGLVLEDDEMSDEVGIRFHIPESDGYEFRNELIEYINGIMPERPFGLTDIKTRIIKNVEWVEAYRRSVKTTVIDRVVIGPP